MRPNLILLLGVLGVVGCDSQIVQKPKVTDGGIVYYPDLRCPSDDMVTTPVAPKCAAAKGLTGDNLLCVDFAKIQMLSSLPEWTFSCVGSSAWTTMDGMLQVSNFATFRDECTAKLPVINLNDTDKTKYKSLTLSVVHRIDLSDPEQQAQIFLNNSSDQTRLTYFATGKKNPSRQTTAISLDKSDLPAMINNAPQWLLKLSSSLQVGRQGWQIESIAVMGNL